MDDVFLGRQTIFTREVGVYAYELLFRSGRANVAGFTDGERATSEVILSAFTDIGLERVVGHHQAFINVTREFLLNERSLPLPPERVVLEILEDVEVDEELVKAVTDLSCQGFRIALDDFVYDDRWQPLLEVADIIKVDVRALGTSVVEEHARILQPYGHKLLAEKVETQEEFDALVAMGFDYFQGYFLSRPQVMSGKRLSASKLPVLQLLALLQDPNIDMKYVEKLVSQDVSLSYKLLRFINSAFFALPGEITSIQRAVVFIGIESLNRWISLIAMARVDDKPHELMRVALVRAKMCELLIGASGAGDEGTAFTIGLFSSLDALMDVPLEEVVGELPLSDEVKLALLERQGPLGEALRTTLAYERCDWQQLSSDELDVNATRNAYLDAVNWSFEVSAGLESA